MSESLEYVAEAVVRLMANMAPEISGTMGGGGPGPRRGRTPQQQQQQPGTAAVPDLLLPVVQRCLGWLGGLQV